MSESRLLVKRLWGPGLPLASLLLVVIAVSGCGGGTSTDSSHPSGANDPVVISPKTTTLLVMFQGPPDPCCVPLGQQQFQAVITGSNTSAVDWLVNGMIGGDSTVGSISTTGLYVVPDEVPSVPVIVTVRSRENPSVTDSATVTLRYPAPAFGRPVPGKIQQGSSATPVTFTGGPFAVAATATVNGVSAPVTRISKTELSVLVPASQLTVQNTLSVQVANPPPGGVSPVPGPGVSLFVVAGSFAVVGDLNTPRQFHAATLLPNGKVLITGGKDASGNRLASAELFDPQTNTFHPAGAMSIARASHSAVLLGNGKVLIAGGETGSLEDSKTGELYDHSTEVFTPIASKMNFAHSARNIPAVLLNDGRVLLAHVNQGAFFMDHVNTEIYDPGSSTFTFVISSEQGFTDSNPCMAAATTDQRGDSSPRSSDWVLPF